jgi:hypothetical protein
MTNSEQGRISEILRRAQLCAIQENLAKARAFQGAFNCPIQTSSNTNVPSEYAYILSLTSNVSCYNYVKPPVPPESVRITQLIQNTLNEESNPLNPITRFIDYNPPAIFFPCPPPSAAVLNASQPKPPNVCPVLPNTPLNPILPI